jgi:hypothetical protein
MVLGSDGVPRNVSGAAEAPAGHGPTGHDLADEALLHDAGIPTGGVPRWAWVLVGVVVLVVLFLMLR